MKRTLMIAAIMGATLIGGAANAAKHANVAVGQMETSAGKILTNGDGMALYTFDKDTDGVSVCKGECAVKWPPLMATAKTKAMGEFTVIKRAGGEYQWAYQGKPLYTWFKDTEMGDITGDGVKGVWHLARP